MEPRALRLARGGKLRVSVSAPAGEAIRLFASEGTVEPAGAGLFDVTPERGGAPRYLQLAAVRVGFGFEPAFAHVPLLARATIPVRTDPGASVTAQVAGETFGPFPADGAGNATVAVDVPPGVREGTTTAVAAGGVASSRPLLLEPPAYRRLFGVLADDEPAADGTLRARLVLAIVDEGRAPPEASALAVEVAPGSLGQVSATGPGRYEAALALAAAQAGPVVVRARLRGDPASSLELAGRLVPSAPAALVIELPSAPALAGAPVEVLVALLDEVGRPAEGPAPSLVAGNAPVAVRRTGRGRWTATVIAPARNTPGQLPLAAWLEAPPLRAAAVLPFVPDEPATLSLAAPSRPLPADGATEWPIGIELVGRSGRPLAEPPAVSASAGEVRVEPQAQGGFVLRFRPPRIERPRPAAAATVRATSGPLASEAVVRLAPVPPRPRARPYLAAWLGGGGVQSGGVGAPGPSGGVSLGLPVLAVHRSAVLAELEATARSSGPVDEVTALALAGLRGGAGPLELEALVGAGVSRLAGGGEDAAVPALGLRARLGLPLGPGAIVLGAGVTRPTSGGGLPASAVTAAGGLSIVGGYRLDL